MASQELRNQTYRVVFMHDGKITAIPSTRATNPPPTTSSRSSYLSSGRSSRATKLSKGTDLIALLRAGGEVPKPAPISQPERLTLTGLRDAYLDANASGAMESNSLNTIRMHLNHVATTLGERFHVQELTLDHL